MPNNIFGTIEDGMPVCEIAIIKPYTNEHVIAKAIIDTGAKDIFIKKSIFESLDISPIGNTPVFHPIDGVIYVDVFRSDIAFGNLRFANFVCNILHATEYPADAIIGYRFLESKIFKYDGLLNTWSIEW